MASGARSNASCATSGRGDASFIGCSANDCSGSTAWSPASRADGIPSGAQRVASCAGFGGSGACSSDGGTKSFGRTAESGSTAELITSAAINITSAASNITSATTDISSAARSVGGAAGSTRHDTRWLCRAANGLAAGHPGQARDHRGHRNGHRHRDAASDGRGRTNNPATSHADPTSAGSPKPGRRVSTAEQRPARPATAYGPGRLVTTAEQHRATTSTAHVTQGRFGPPAAGEGNC